MKIGTPGFRGERLRAAREARGLTGVALAEMIGVTGAAVSQYEKGDQTPSPTTLRAMSARLNLPINYFLRPVADHRGGPVFCRSMASATKSARTRAVRRYEWLREIVAFLQQYLRFATVDVPEFGFPSDPDKITTDMIEEAATATRRHWGLGDGPISNVVWLLENKGVVVARHAIGAETVEAFSQWSDVDGRPYVIIGTDKGTAVRWRFDAAHELAHLVLHRRLDPSRITKLADHKVIEEQAHRFAGAFLLPAESFLADLYASNLDALRSLKSRWHASIGVMLKRATDLGAVPDDQAQRLWINLSRRGWRRNEPLDDQLPAEQPRFLRRCFSMLIERGVVTPDSLAAHFHWTSQEIEDLCGLDPGTLTLTAPEEEITAPEPTIIRFPGFGSG